MAAWRLMQVKLHQHELSRNNYGSDVFGIKIFVLFIVGNPSEKSKSARLLEGIQKHLSTEMVWRR
jgi:hypothetical protein